MVDINLSRTPNISELTKKTLNSHSDINNAPNITDIILFEATSYALVFGLPYLSDPWLIYNIRDLFNI